MAVIEQILKELPLEFTGQGEVRGFLFSQVCRTDKGYIYRVQEEDKVWYEVFKRKTNQFDGISYPKSKSFGVWAWWYGSLDRAKEKLNSF